MVDTKNNNVVIVECSQRPQRATILTRKVLEAITPNINLRPLASDKEQ